MTAAAAELWNPGLENGRRLLGEVYETLPGNPASSVPWWVRLLENPTSPVALPGAVDLFGHDCTHILLGRGLLPQDEAFVLGFTMGASGACARWQQTLFRFSARYLYCGVYRFSDIDAGVFDMAVEVGRRAGTAPVHQVDFRGLLARPVGEIRQMLGIKRDVLGSAYAVERARWPHTDASARLAPRRTCVA
jgi:hypothetical protein